MSVSRPTRTRWIESVGQFTSAHSLGSVSLLLRGRVGCFAFAVCAIAAGEQGGER